MFALKAVLQHTYTCTLVINTTINRNGEGQPTHWPVCCGWGTGRTGLLPNILLLKNERLLLGWWRPARRRLAPMGITCWWEAGTVRPPWGTVEPGEKKKTQNEYSSHHQQGAYPKLLPHLTTDLHDWIMWPSSTYRFNQTTAPPATPFCCWVNQPCELWGLGSSVGLWERFVGTPTVREGLAELFEWVWVFVSCNSWPLAWLSGLSDVESASEPTLSELKQEM